MPKYPVIFPLLHNGKRYSEGDLVEMETPEAEKLQDMGILETAVKQSAAKTGKE